MEQEKNELFHSMYLTYEKTLKTIALSFDLPNDDADDVVQDTFLSYYQKYSLDWDEKSQKWMLVKILKNKCNDYYRKFSRHPQVSMDCEAFSGEKEKLQSRNSLDGLSTMIKQEYYQAIRDCLDTMKPEWKEILMLSVVQDLPVQVVSKYLDISESACRVRLSRARKELNRLFDEKYSNLKP